MSICKTPLECFGGTHKAGCPVKTSKEAACDYCKKKYPKESMGYFKTREDDSDLSYIACQDCLKRLRATLRKFRVQMTFVCIEEPIEETEEQAFETAETWARDTGVADAELVEKKIVSIIANPPIISREWRIKEIQRLMGRDITLNDIGGVT